ncbi:XRE family transcriptional regulator [Desulfovibrio sp. Huiquan2017]|uniref:XRE family transcriptional regulator n=1 Tax=Desulfovibrio sp. Huiquan2017 TaxID=2816861 RepID=UPI001A912EA4|nr:XRE family transcriptional regulator [Desulfovibrio sp. Huiquan2017]
MKSNSLQHSLDNLNPKQVTVARELRGMTKKDLADKIGKSPSAITRIENGNLRPEIDTLLSLSQTLKVHHSFFSFSYTIPSPIDISDCHFRSRRSTSLIQKRMAKQQGERLYDLINHFQSFGITFIDEQISHLSTVIKTSADIEELAYNIRNEWDIGLGPITDLMGLLESKGIRIIMLSGDNFGKVDAFSAWISSTPCIFLYSDKPASRINFDLAHEFGHLLFHQDIETGDNATEREADKFASNFLLPRTTFLADCPRRWSLQGYLSLKRKWKVSIAAMLYRAKELRIISESSYRRSCIAMSPYRKNEPGEFPHSKPDLLPQIIELLKDEIRVGAVATDLGYSSKDELRSILADQGVSAQLFEEIDRQPVNTSSNLVYLHK